MLQGVGTAAGNVGCVDPGMSCPTSVEAGTGVCAHPTTGLDRIGRAAPVEGLWVLGAQKKTAAGRGTGARRDV